MKLGDILKAAMEEKKANDGKGKLSQKQRVETKQSFKGNANVASKRIDRGASRGG